jgi:hypothetical protein
MNMVLRTTLLQDARDTIQVSTAGEDMMFLKDDASSVKNSEIIRSWNEDDSSGSAFWNICCSNASSVGAFLMDNDIVTALSAIPSAFFLARKSTSKFFFSVVVLVNRIIAAFQMKCHSQVVSEFRTLILP